MSFSEIFWAARSFFSLVAAGTLVLGSGGARADFLHNEDVLIDGSLCVGDCAGGSGFPFDSELILRGPVLRLLFADVGDNSSVDWLIQVNSKSSSGGPFANYFAIRNLSEPAIPFRIDSGAPHNALRIDAQGDVGLGTSNPRMNLHIADGNTPAIRLEQTGSAGFTPRKWDIAANEFSFFIRDATKPSTLPFRIRPGAPTNALHIGADGDVFIGLDPQSKTAPSGDLVVGGAGAKYMDLVSTNNVRTWYRMISDSENRRLVAMDSGGSIKTQMVFNDNRIRFGGPSFRGFNLWATIDSSGITTRGPTCKPGPCDAVFDRDVYEAPSIKAHAALMWESGYLPGVGPTVPGASVNLSQKLGGILNELEHAHIYIEQLDQQTATLAEQNAALLDRVATLEVLIEPSAGSNQ